MMKTFQLITVYLWLLSVTRIAKLCYLIRSKELQVCKRKFSNCTAVYARLFRLCWLINCDDFKSLSINDHNLLSTGLYVNYLFDILSQNFSQIIFQIECVQKHSCMQDLSILDRKGHVAIIMVMHFLGCWFDSWKLLLCTCSFLKRIIITGKIT